MHMMAAPSVLQRCFACTFVVVDHDLLWRLHHFPAGDSVGVFPHGCQGPGDAPVHEHGGPDGGGAGHGSFLLPFLPMLHCFACSCARLTCPMCVIGAMDGLRSAIQRCVVVINFPCMMTYLPPYFGALGLLPFPHRRPEMRVAWPLTPSPRYVPDWLINHFVPTAHQMNYSQFFSFSVPLRPHGSAPGLRRNRCPAVGQAPAVQPGGPPGAV